MDSEEIEVIEGQDGSPGNPGRSSEELNERASSQDIGVDEAQEQEVQIEN